MDIKANINITMDDDELQDMIRKGVKPKDESRVRLDQYLYWRLHIYDLYEWKGAILSDSFAEDFQHFDRDDFEAFKKDDIKRLRNHLRSKGVFVRIRRFLAISDALVEAIREELVWSENDSDRPSSQHQNSTATTIPTISTASNSALNITFISIIAPNSTPVSTITPASNIAEIVAPTYERMPHLLPSLY